MAPKRKKQQAEKALVDEDKLLSKVEDTTQVNKERIPEEIVEIRVKKGKTEYRIKWAGYDLRYRSWVPEESILDPHLVESFEEKCARNLKEEGNQKSPKAAEKTDEKKRRISNGRVKVDKKGCSKTKEIIGKKQTKQTNEKQKLTTSKKIQKKEGTTAVKKHIKKIKGSKGETGSMPTTKTKSSFRGATPNNSEKRDASSDGGDVGNIESTQPMLAPPAPPRHAQTITEQSMGQQKIQVVKRLDGSMQVRGLLPGQQLAQMPDGKLQVFSTVNRQATPQQPQQFVPIQNALTNNNYAVRSVQSAPTNYISPIQNAPTIYNSAVRSVQNAPTHFNSGLRPNYNVSFPFNPQRHIPVPPSPPLDRLNWPLADRQYPNVSDLNSPNDYSVIDQYEDGNSLFFEDRHED